MKAFSAIACIVCVTCIKPAVGQYENYGGELDNNLFEPNYPKIQAPAIKHTHEEDFDLDYHAHPKYSFDYAVKDPHTGDHKDHWETRDGDRVKGTYTLLETDGTKRVVEYEADDKNGFNAVVHKIGKPIVVEHEKHVGVPVPVPVPVQGGKYEPLLHFDGGYEEGFVPMVPQVPYKRSGHHRQ